MAPNTSKTTQDFVPIKEVRDGIMILKDGSMRAVLLVTSINFALKSSDEQQSVIFQFQNFLNSLDFSVQMYVQSRKLDIKPYLAILEGRYKEQTNDLMKIQIKEYVEFIKNLTEGSNIMTKSFFLIVPFTPPSIDVVKSSKGFFGPKKAVQTQKENEAESFLENRTQIEQRVSVVEQGINRCGLRTVQLGTEEVIELFYKLFNPGDVEKPINIK